MDNQYNVRSYSSGDEEEIVKLLELVFNGWPPFDLDCTPLDHWRWKYLANPYGVKAIALATINNKIIGSAHGIIKRVKLGNRYSITGMGADASVHLDHRKSGIYTEIRKHQNKIYRDNNFRYCSAISSNPILIKRNIRRGNPVFPTKLASYIRVNDVKLHLQRVDIKKKSLFSYRYKIMSKIGALKAITKSLDTSIEVKDISFFDEDADLLWNRSKDYYDYIVVRDREYLNWRYCDPHGGRYFIKGAFEDGKLIGYIVLRINSIDRDYPVGYIVDLFTLPERLDIVTKLVDESIIFFEGKNVNAFWYIGIKSNLIEKILNRVGFVLVSHSWGVFFRKQFINDEDLRLIRGSSADRVHFSYGDHDPI